MADMLVSYGLIGLTRALVGASARYVENGLSGRQAIYFANHSSHMDTIALWSAIPAELRPRARPVAALDYWGKSAIKRYIAVKCLNAVLIDRARERDADPLGPLIEALNSGDSLIIFPEGTRTAQRLPSTFKSGIFRLAQSFPNVDLVPVYLENMHRSLPKGSFVPVPLICTVRFGAPLNRVADETKEAFLERARKAVIALA